METKDFINQIMANDNVGAKETIENILSSRAVEILDDYKKAIAQTMFGNNTEEEQEEAQ
jgi:hypothetical protein